MEMVLSLKLQVTCLMKVIAILAISANHIRRSGKGGALLSAAG